MSRALTSPCMMLKPLTPAVIVPSVAAANAVVDIWPRDIAEAVISEYSMVCVLQNMSKLLWQVQDKN